MLRFVIEKRVTRSTMLLLFVLWSACTRDVTFAAKGGLCRRLQFKTPAEDHALINHVIKSLTISVPRDSCLSRCHVQEDCVSFNMGPVSNNKAVCEPSDSDDIEHPSDLVKRQGFIYRGTENACSRNACFSNGKCLNGFTDKNYLCRCNEGFVGEQCEPENWQKINTDPVCFGARDDTYGAFTITTPGLVSTFKLVHRNGIITCSVDRPPSYWGCDLLFLKNNTFKTLITFDNKTTLLPAQHLFFVDPEDRCQFKYSYALAGFGLNSTQLVFDHLPSPLSVSLGQEFQIWFGEDLHNCHEHGNSGQTCVDIYAWYI